MAEIATLKTIAAMAASYGVTLRTLRFYENRGLLHPLRIGQMRHYSAKDCIRLQLILKGKRLGFSLAEIARIIDHSNSPDEDKPNDSIALSRDQIKSQLEKLERKKGELKLAINDLRRCL